MFWVWITRSTCRLLSISSRFIPTWRAERRFLPWVFWLTPPPPQPDTHTRRKKKREIKGRPRTVPDDFARHGASQTVEICLLYPSPPVLACEHGLGMNQCWEQEELQREICEELLHHLTVRRFFQSMGLPHLPQLSLVHCRTCHGLVHIQAYLRRLLSPPEMKSHCKSFFDSLHKPSSFHLPLPQERFSGGLPA